MSKASTVSNGLTKTERESIFMASGATVKTNGEVRNLYRKYDPYLNVHRQINVSLFIAFGIVKES